MALPVLTDLDLNDVARITGAPDPVGDTELVNKRYVDAAIEGTNWKDSVRVATQANLNLAAPGAAIDGVAMAANDRVLVRVQDAAAENGLYVWNGAAVAMTRSADADTADKLEQAVVTVEDGSSAAANYRQSVIDFVLDTDAVTWSNFGAAAGPAGEASAGIVELATQAETDAEADDSRAVTPAKLGAWAGRIGRYEALFGDGGATQFDLNHNLNSRDVTVTIYRNSGGYEEVMMQVEHLTVNSVRITTVAAPAANAFRAVVKR